MTPTSPKSAETTVDEADFDEIMVDNSTDVDDHESRGGKKAKPTFRLTEVESLLFFNIIQFNRCPDQVGWEKVAEHSGLKNNSAKVSSLAEQRLIPARLILTITRFAIVKSSSNMACRTCCRLLAGSLLWSVFDVGA